MARVLVACEFSGVVRMAFAARVHRMPPRPDRWKERSRFFEGVATAMADQWGRLLDGEEHNGDAEFRFEKYGA